VARIDTTQSGSGSLQYSTYLGGSASSAGTAVATDGSGGAYVTGTTFATDYDTTTGAFDETADGGDDAFVSKIDTDLSGLASLAYSTYLGGTAREQGNGIAVDSAGSAYVTGFTESTDFDLVNSLEGDSGGDDGFVTKLNPAGSALTYSTYLGGGGDDEPKAIAVDSTGAAHVTGATDSGDFNAVDAVDTRGNFEDAFVSKLVPAGNSLAYSTLLSGGGFEEGNGIAVDSGGAAYVAGQTGSSNFPTTRPIEGFTGSGDAFVSKLVIAPFCGGAKPTILGTGGADVLAGTAGRDVIHGLGGRDRIRGLGGRDILCGADGPDRLSGNNGNDRLIGANGNDRLFGNRGRDRLKGGKGRDRLFGGRGRDVLRGGPGRDVQIQG
jgi:Ca2+-binding RTX toxin-like protein